MADIVDGIFPEQAIHLVAGSTGAGKSRWLLEWLADWQAGRPILDGYVSHPVPWLYVSGDRSEKEAKATIIDLGINPTTIPLFAAFGVMPPIGALGVLEEAEKRDVGLIVWEGFGQYVESNAGSSKVKSWLNMVTFYLSHTLGSKKARSRPLTIIGVMEQPKMKPRDKYQNARQRISGPAAWGHTASTIVMVEHQRTDCKGPLRNLEIYPHHGGVEIIKKASLATGHFVLIP
jgi:AAA domain